MSEKRLKKKLDSEGGDKDKRNIRLVKSGLLNTKDFAQPGEVSKIDMDARIRLFTEKQRALKKNPNLFISETRLCVRNLPRKYTEKELKTIIQHFLEEWKHSLTHDERKLMALKTKKIIHQVKVLVDENDKNAEGEAKAKGMGFVELEYHEAAYFITKAANNLTLN